MRWFISALIILGILAGSLYAVNREVDILPSLKEGDSR